MVWSAVTGLEDFWKARAIQGWAECVVFEDKPALRLPEPWAFQNLLSSPKNDLATTTLAPVPVLGL